MKHRNALVEALPGLIEIAAKGDVFHLGKEAHKYAKLLIPKIDAFHFCVYVENRSLPFDFAYVSDGPSSLRGNMWAPDLDDPNVVAVQTGKTVHLEQAHICMFGDVRQSKVGSAVYLPLYGGGGGSLERCLPSFMMMANSPEIKFRNSNQVLKFLGHWYGLVNE